MSSTTLNIQGMRCEGCVAKVEQALRGVPGVATVAVDLKHGSAVVEGGAPETLAAAVRSAGFRAEAAPGA